MKVVWKKWCHGESGRPKKAPGESKVNGDRGIGIVTREGLADMICLPQLERITCADDGVMVFERVRLLLLLILS